MRKRLVRKSLLVGSVVLVALFVGVVLYVAVPWQQEKNGVVGDSSAPPNSGSVSSFELFEFADPLNETQCGTGAQLLSSSEGTFHCSYALNALPSGASTFCDDFPTSGGLGFQWTQVLEPRYQCPPSARFATNGKGINYCLWYPHFLAGARNIKPLCKNSPLQIGYQYSYNNKPSSRLNSEVPQLPPPSNSTGDVGSVISMYWEIEYGWKNPDGVYRFVYYIVDENGVEHLPGPTIFANRGDILNITVMNNLTTESVSIHWHGLTQSLSQWMDGVPGITQNPIGPMQTFQYWIPLNQTGTFWYHSHSGTQYADGLFGALVIYDDTNDINSTYNVVEEKTIVINEWYHRSSLEIDAELKGMVWRAEGHFPNFESGLMNGKSYFPCREWPRPPYQWRTSNDALLCDNTNSTFEVISVNSSSSYRLRLLNAGSGFTFRFSIDNHPLTVVAVDGVPICPTTVDEIYIYVAQRYDVILNATQPVDSYWIRARTFEEAVLAHEHEEIFGEVKGVLRYQGAEPKFPKSKPTKPETSLTNDTVIVPKVPVLPPPATKNFTITLFCSEDEWICYANGIAFQSPPVPAMLSALLDLDIKMGNNNTQYIPIEYGDVVDLIIINLGGQSHPVHLHGHHFWILGEAKNSNYSEGVSLNLDNPILRDTTQLKEHGWTVLRFVADNPGAWVFHCHIDWHLESGMLLFFLEAPSMIPAPPGDFPVVTSYAMLEESMRNNNSCPPPPPAPVLQNLRPSFGPVPWYIYLFGDNLLRAGGAAPSVYFTFLQDDYETQLPAAGIVPYSTTQIGVNIPQLPPNVTSLTVTLETDQGNTECPIPYLVFFPSQPPVLNSAYLPGGGPGTWWYLSGSNFVAQTTVIINGNTYVSAGAVYSTESLGFTLPSNFVGLVTLQLSTSYGTSGYLNVTANP